MPELIINTGTSVAVNNDEPDLAEGSQTAVAVGDNSGIFYHAFLRIGLAALPAEVTVTSAVLAMVRNENSANHVVSRLTQTHNASEASWNERAAGASWTTPGGTIDAIPSPVFNGTTSLTINVLAILQEAIAAGATTLDLCIRDLLEGFDPTALAVYEGFGSGNPPTLSISYALSTSFVGNHGVHWRPQPVSVQGNHGAHWAGW